MTFIEEPPWGTDEPHSIVKRHERGQKNKTEKKNKRNNEQLNKRKSEQTNKPSPRGPAGRWTWRAPRGQVEQERPSTPSVAGTPRCQHRRPQGRRGRRGRRPDRRCWLLVRVEGVFVRVMWDLLDSRLIICLVKGCLSRTGCGDVSAV